MAQVKRETAKVCRVLDILNGRFIKAEGWTPSYFSTPLGNISRVNILGVIISSDSEGDVLDDGTGRVVLRSFEESSFNRGEVGSFVMVVGRPRMYNEQKYIMPEFIKKINPAWAEYRKKEIAFLESTSPSQPPESRVVINEPVQQTATQYQKIIEFIRDLDSGSGADAEEVEKRTGLSNANELIRKLIEEGEIFELKPGMLKILE